MSDEEEDDVFGGTDDGAGDRLLNDEELIDRSVVVNMTKRHRVVVFVDMLGFSKLTEEHPLQPNIFEELQRPGAVEFLRASLEGMEANSLTERFIRFHLLIGQVAREVRLVEDGSSITFSDCAFFATDNLHYAIEYAWKVMYHTMEQRIPVRIGIGYGEFLVVRIKADFGLTNEDHVVQFLGSGVARAYAAEHCGIKGQRVLIHPSVERLFEHEGHQPMYRSKTRWQFPMPLPDGELTNSAGVTKEINYLWHSKHDDMYWESVNEMRAVSPEVQHVHYDATLAAINRMRLTMDRPLMASPAKD